MVGGAFCSQLPCVARAANHGNLAHHFHDWLRMCMQLEQLKAEFDTPLDYPDYYLKPFHTYTNGNLEWLAASEVRPRATSTLDSCCVSHISQQL